MLCNPESAEPVHTVALGTVLKLVILSVDGVHTLSYRSL